jgi:pimeloyl-ACP methyl ester carboxylesterase
MKRLAMEKGLLPGGLSFVRLGDKPHSVVIFPGLADAAWDVTSKKWDFASQYRRLAETFTVYIVSRKRDMPDGFTTRDMAADYARAFECEIGRADVLGISLGGYVAQHFAADYPDYVDRLVIGCAAHRVSDEGRKTPERWLALAVQKRWREFYRDIGRVTMAEYHNTFARLLMPLLQKGLNNPADFLVSLKACLAHDSSEYLGHIQASTLVIGGTKDIFFPPSLLRETAKLIPSATLGFIPGGGHSAYELHKAEFDDTVLEFLGVPETTAIADDSQSILGHELEVTA